MPTAVITESSEKTMSSMHDLDDHARKAPPPRRRLALLALQPLVDLAGALQMRKSPPTRRIRSRPEISVAQDA